jgi:hypothetical protein
VVPDLKKQGCLALKANKENAMVILKKQAYDDSLSRMLLYEVVSKTPLNRIVRKVTNTLVEIKNKHGVGFQKSIILKKNLIQVADQPRTHKKSSER